MLHNSNSNNHNNYSNNYHLFHWPNHQHLDQVWDLKLSHILNYPPQQLSTTNTEKAISHLCLISLYSNSNNKGSFTHCRNNNNSNNTNNSIDFHCHNHKLHNKITIFTHLQQLCHPFNHIILLIKTLDMYNLILQCKSAYKLNNIKETVVALVIVVVIVHLDRIRLLRVQHNHRIISIQEEHINLQWRY